MKRHMPCGFALAALLAVLAAPALLAQGPPSAPRASQATAPVPDHSVSGVVKFVDRVRLVITRAGKTPVEMTFSVNASTQKEGAIAAGAKVQVRFRGDATRTRRSPRRFSRRRIRRRPHEGSPRHQELNLAKDEIGETLGVGAEVMPAAERHGAKAGGLDLMTH